MVKNSTLLYLNGLSGFIFAVLMILKYELSFISGSMLVWPIATLIYGYLWEINYTRKNDNRSIYRAINGHDKVNSIGIIIISLAAYLTLWSIPTLQFSHLEEYVLVFLPFSLFLFTQMIYYGRLGRMLAHNRVSHGES